MYVWTQGKRRERERNRSGRCMCRHEVRGEREKGTGVVDVCVDTR